MILCLNITNDGLLGNHIITLIPHAKKISDYYMLDSEIQEQIKRIFYKKREEEKAKNGHFLIPLAAPSYDHEEIIDALDSMISTWVTMGEKVKMFEQQFSEYIGCKNGIMVNSGSSANLLALSILSNPGTENFIKKDSQIITPAVTWATTVSPIVNVGCVPMFVDVDLDTLCINPDQIKDAINSQTACVLPVLLMGNPCDMKEISKITKENDLYLVEDSCEAHGATFDKKRVGSFGDIGTFSFFMSHHISTMEGGMVVTNNESLAEMGKTLRTFGWTRELKDKDRINSEYPEIDPRFLFVNTGYNFRPTEIQGAFGRNQLPKLDSLIKIRRENASYWNDELSKYSEYIMHPTRNLENHVYFGYAITIKENAPFLREELTKFLEARGIETRPIMSGNYLEQPAAKLIKHKKIGELKNAKLIMSNSFFIGNHHKVSQKERELVVDSFNDFFKQL